MAPGLHVACLLKDLKMVFKSSKQFETKIIDVDIY
jgi:hypothetical protein